MFLDYGLVLGEADAERLVVIRCNFQATGCLHRADAASHSISPPRHAAVPVFRQTQQVARMVEPFLSSPTPNLGEGGEGRCRLGGSHVSGHAEICMARKIRSLEFSRLSQPSDGTAVRT
jgi:hypothetical protein